MSHLNAPIVRLYDTVFDRAPDAEGLEFWNGATHNGFGLRDLANFFIAAPEFASTYGEPATRGFVEAMYRNVLDRPGEAEGIAFWTNALDQGLADRAQVVVGFSESAEHIQQMNQPHAQPPAPPGFDFSRRLSGDEGPNLLVGTGDIYVIDGWGGDNTISGGTSDSWLSGGNGRDHISGGPGNDHIYQPVDKMPPAYRRHKIARLPGA